MTEALDKMVAAMVAEARRQECRLVLEPDGVTLDSGYDGAQFDMELVARAGLQAMKALPQEVFEVADGFEVYGTPIGIAEQVVDTVIDAILKEPET